MIVEDQIMDYKLHLLDDECDILSRQGELSKVFRRLAEARQELEGMDMLVSAAMCFVTSWMRFADGEPESEVFTRAKTRLIAASLIYSGVPKEEAEQKARVIVRDSQQDADATRTLAKAAMCYVAAGCKDDEGSMADTGGREEAEEELVAAALDYVMLSRKRELTAAEARVLSLKDQHERCHQLVQTTVDIPKGSPSSSGG